MEERDKKEERKEEEGRKEGCMYGWMTDGWMQRQEKLLSLLMYAADDLSKVYYILYFHVTINTKHRRAFYR